VAERRGLTAPANPAEELKRIMQEEAKEAMKASSQEASFLPSLEGAQEDRKLPSGKGAEEGRKASSQEASFLPSLEDWKENVKARAKAGGREERKVRLNVDIPADIHLQMKMWCLKEGYNLNEVIPALVALFLEGEED
jgi:hypothetical protein